MGQAPILQNGVESRVGLLDTTTSQTHAIGAKASLPDGRVFRWALADTTGWAAGLVLVSPALVTANHTNVNLAAAVSAGSLTAGIALGATAATENQYAGGFLWINDGTGEGHVYGIKSHPAAALSTTLTVTLNDPIKVALVASATSQVTLVSNAYNGATIGGAAPATRVVGISQVAIAASAYGWVQTRGTVSCLASTTGPTVGSMLIPGAAGTVTVVTAATEQTVGWCINAETASGDQCLVYATIE